MLLKFERVNFAVNVYNVQNNCSLAKKIFSFFTQLAHNKMKACMLLCEKQLLMLFCVITELFMHINLLNMSRRGYGWSQRPTSTTKVEHQTLFPAHAPVFTRDRELAAVGAEVEQRLLA